jgi:hypothetical protein
MRLILLVTTSRRSKPSHGWYHLTPGYRKYLTFFPVSLLYSSLLCMGSGEAYKRVHTFIENGALTSFSEFYGTRCIHDIQYVSKSVSQDGLVNIPTQTRDRKFDSSGKWRAKGTWETVCTVQAFR